MKNCPEIWNGSDETLFDLEIKKQPKEEPKIIQDVKMAVIKAVKEGGGNGAVNITVNMNANTGQQFLGPSGRRGIVTVPDTLPNASPLQEDSLLLLINSFPEPRIKHFVDWIHYIALKKFRDNKTHAAEWLGISSRRIRPSYKTKWRDTNDLDKSNTQLR